MDSAKVFMSETSLQHLLSHDTLTSISTALLCPLVAYSCITELFRFKHPYIDGCMCCLRWQPVYEEQSLCHSHGFPLQSTVTNFYIKTIYLHFIFFTDYLLAKVKNGLFMQNYV